MAGASSQEELVARVLEMAASPTAFGVWMLVVASMRALSVFLGYCAPSQLHGKVFAVDAARFKQGVGGIQFTALTGRTFAVWTAVTCIVCLAAAARPADTPTLHLAAATFLVADAFFFAELLVYRTATIGSIAAPFVFANTSIVWIVYLLHRAHGDSLGLEWVQGTELYALLAGAPKAEL